MTTTILEDRCFNWGEVMRSRGGSPTAIKVDEKTGKVIERRYFARVSSYESNYRSPSSIHWSYGTVPPAPVKADTRDADVIEQAVRDVYAFDATLLRMWYVRRLAEDVCMRIARKAGANRKFHSFEIAMVAALASLEDVLRLRASSPKDFLYHY